MKKIFFFLIIHSTLFNFHSVAQDNAITKKDTSEIRFINARKFFIYKVDKGETLYSISKKFFFPEEEITKSTPELKDGLKEKMKLCIPAYSHLKKDREKKVEKEKHPAD